MSRSREIHMKIYIWNFGLVWFIGDSNHNSTDSHLSNACLRPAALPLNEQDPIKHANKLWALLKESIKKAARDLPNKIVTPAQAHSIDNDPPSLLAKRANHRYVFRLIANMRKLQFYILDTIRKLWTSIWWQLLNLMSTYSIQHQKFFWDQTCGDLWKSQITAFFIHFFSKNLRSSAKMQTS